MPFAGKSVALEIIILSKIRLVEKGKYCMSHAESIPKKLIA
jgi:hypothetical protein